MELAWRRLFTATSLFPSLFRLPRRAALWGLLASADSD